MASVINREATKRFILAKLANMRPGHPVSRVGSDALDHYEARLRAWIVEDVRRLPSAGKTYKAAYLVSAAG